MEHAWRVEAIDEWPLAPDHSEPQIADEPLGTKEKFWVRAADGQEFLFKYARVSQGRTMGEDWAEWAVHRLATMLSIPTAATIPALHNGRRGVHSRSILSPGERLIHGNELLARIDSDYDTQVPRHNSRYTVEAVHDALAGIGAPRACPAPIRTAFDAWAGYLMRQVPPEYLLATGRIFRVKLLIHNRERILHGD
ncbi:hypothetical protein [Tomitella gaofuii]|uniref:hypothetical protein n=1 Tax=Tomitella gaofuii TaxID=2760083 RepID=UPI0015F830B6|nr:hypothetical protein [Tomitella gaofuii]